MTMVRSSALFGGPDDIYRYELRRVWNEARPVVLFIMLNPSTADESTDDPTIRRCINFARDWGYGALTVGNLFALRTKHSKRLLRSADPIGPENDRTLMKLIDEHLIVVAAWGAFGSRCARAREVCRLIGPSKCLGVTRAGFPRHPLYVQRYATMLDWNGMI